MKCLRCGYCCIQYCVVVVKGPEKDPYDSDNLMYLNGPETPCPHLKGNKPGEYSCAIHHYPWFKDTPCGQHTQFEIRNEECRIGQYILKREKENERRKEKISDRVVTQTT